jgi:hypothetical protein
MVLPRTRWIPWPSSLFTRTLEIRAERLLRKKRVFFDRYSDANDLNTRTPAAIKPRIDTWLWRFLSAIPRISSSEFTRVPGWLEEMPLTASDPTSPKTNTAAMSRIPRNA